MFKMLCLRCYVQDVMFEMLGCNDPSAGKYQIPPFTFFKQNEPCIRARTTTKFPIPHSLQSLLS